MNSKNNMIDIIKMSRIIGLNHNKVIHEVAKKYNMSLCEADMLLILTNNSEIINAKDVICSSKVSKSYVSKSINLLVNKNLIEITLDEFDKRKQKIIVSDNANKIIKDLKKTQKKYLQNLKTDISDDELNTFISILKKMSKNIINKKEGKNNV